MICKNRWLSAGCAVIFFFIASNVFAKDDLYAEFLNIGDCLEQARSFVNIENDRVKDEYFTSGIQGVREGVLNAQEFWDFRVLPFFSKDTFFEKIGAVYDNCYFIAAVKNLSGFVYFKKNGSQIKQQEKPLKGLFNSRRSFVDLLETGQVFLLEARVSKDEDNPERLSYERGMKVRDMLIRSGISGKRIRIRSFDSRGPEISKDIIYYSRFSDFCSLTQLFKMAGEKMEKVNRSVLVYVY